MLEIVLIIALWQRMGTMMRSRGYVKTLGFQILVPICWMGTEFIVGFAFGFIRRLKDEAAPSGFDWQPYVGALVGAALCTGLLFFIASQFRKEDTAAPPPLP